MKKMRRQKETPEDRNIQGHKGGRKNENKLRWKDGQMGRL